MKKYKHKKCKFSTITQFHMDKKYLLLALDCKCGARKASTYQLIGSDVVKK